MIVTKPRNMLSNCNSHDSYAQARGQILMMQTLPNVNQAYALVIQDESQKGIAGFIHEGMESTALYTGRSKVNQTTHFQKKPFTPLYCDYCHMRGHVKDDCNKLKRCSHCHASGHVVHECFQLIGYPENWKGKKKVNAALAGSQMYDPHQVAHDQLLKKVNAVQGGQMCTQDQMMQLMQKATPEQCQQILHVLSKNNMDETFSTINVAGNSSLYLVNGL